MAKQQRTKKRVFKKLTLRLSLWEYRDLEDLKKEVHQKTLSKAILKASTNYKKLKLLLFETQNQLDILNYEKSRLNK